MRTRLLLLTLSCLTTVWLPLGSPSRAEEPPRRRLTVIDYFLLLPKDTFEEPPAKLLEILRLNKETVDPANGYISAGGDGAQTSFEVALFRYRDDRPLLALCDGILETADNCQLHFFELTPDGGALRKVSRAIFPVKDGEDRRFDLPRHGKTVLVRDAKSGRIRGKFAWDGEKFRDVTKEK